jgi:putative oxidoreductase
MNSTSTSSFTTSAFPVAGRLLLAAIFLVSGFGKLANPTGTIGYIASVGLPAPLLGYVAALVVELGGGVLLVLGYRTRWVAAVLAAFSVVSALIFHNALGDQNQLFHFFKNIAMAGGLLQVIAFGAGSYSIDNRRKARSALGPAQG